MQKTHVWSLNWTNPLENGMAPHSSILAWRIPWTGAPSGLEYKGENKHMKMSFSVFSESLSHIQLFVTPWTIQSMEFSRPELLEWVAFPFRGSSQPRDWTQVSHIADGFFTSWTTREVICVLYSNNNLKDNDHVFVGSETQPNCDLLICPCFCVP